PRDADSVAVEPRPARGASFHEVYPLLVRSCLSCHGPDKELGDFRVDRREDYFGAVGREPLVVPGAGAASPLIDIVSGARPEMRMAARHRLPPHEVELLKAWIDAGAAWSPRGDQP